LKRYHLMSRLHFSPRSNRAAQIRWRPWGRPAFDEAKEQAKPVLLAISAVWCHWCHVMDETSYSDPAIIEHLNERFIPVRVDNDQRPDVNARYNMGGWPTTALLTPEGEVLYGGTYIPPEAMRQVLKQIDAFYSEADNRLAIVKRVNEMRSARAGRSRTPSGGDLDPNTAANVMTSLSSAFDEEFGGFGNDQKFPHVSALQFALDDWSRSHDAQAQLIVQRTLHAMAGGGMYDHVQGAFFRYSTTRDFSVPHFEKMLEDLGGLLHVCARAGAMFDDAHLRRIAIDVKRYLDERLWNEAFGAYGGSQDADEDYYGLDAAGRAQVQAPYVDPTVYASWNAQAARALISSAPLLAADGIDVSAWMQRGLAILDMLWSKLLVDGMMCRYFDGSAHVRGLLADQAWSAWAALSAFEATGEERWLERSHDLVERAGLLFDPDAQGYLDRLAASDDPGRISEQIVVSEDNALMARVLLQHAAFETETRYAERAQAMLRRFARDYPSLGLFAAGYASAVLDVTSPPVDVHVVGPLSDPATTALRRAALRVTSPPLRVDTLDPEQQSARAAVLGYTSDGVTAYLCRGTTCFARVVDPAALEAALAAQRSVT
jgi:uncharacterized protein